jgi:hypothetical protein
MVAGIKKEFGADRVFDQESTQGNLFFAYYLVLITCLFVGLYACLSFFLSYSLVPVCGPCRGCV